MDDYQIAWSFNPWTLRGLLTAEEETSPLETSLVFQIEGEGDSENEEEHLWSW